MDYIDFLFPNRQILSAFVYINTVRYTNNELVIFDFVVRAVSVYPLIQHTFPYVQISEGLRRKPLGGKFNTIKKVTYKTKFHRMKIIISLSIVC